MLLLRLLLLRLLLLRLLLQRVFALLQAPRSCSPAGIPYALVDASEVPSPRRFYVLKKTVP
jgi:hypothetical protein